MGPVRTGIQTEQDNKPVVVRLSGILEKGATALEDDTLAALHTLLLDFLTWAPIVPHDPRKLAEMLAPLCRYLRSDVFAAVEREGSALAHLCADIRQYLFPHTDHKEFADIYAQTLTYSLLLARLEDPDSKVRLSSEDAAKRLDSGHGLLAQTLRILTQPEARAEIETAVSVLERLVGAVEPHKLAKHGDPWIYFYEHFLAAYDNKMRLSYGVVYTPQEVIGCQVALVSELLVDRFEKHLTFADEGVVFLDSSTGTAAYPIAAIESALRRVERRFGLGAVAEHATRCAENVYAFEILVGAYAVAHLRLTKLLIDAGATLPADGLHVLLTDTLESPYADPPQPPLFGKKLTDEQRRASRVKAEVPIFVCMGNPPYFREESDDSDGERTRGKWVRFGDDSKPEDPAILQDFTEPVIASGGARFVANLYNLYVYFWRWTLWKMFENPFPGGASGKGIVSFITASSYLRGPGFGGMRQRMREAFDEIWILDLEGTVGGPRSTENVFAITTAVCIATGVRHAAKKKHALARVRYSRVIGTREEKLAKLKEINVLADVQWHDCFEGAMEPMVPKQEGNFFDWPLVSDLWPWEMPGVKFHRSWPIAETRELLIERWNELLASPAEMRGILMRNTATHNASGNYVSFLDDKRLPSIAQLKAGTEPLTAVRYSFRAFDRQWALPDMRVCDRPRPPLWRAHGKRQTYITSLMTTAPGEGPAAIACAHVPDLHHFRGSFGGRDIIPLWRDAAGNEANLPAGLLDVLMAALGFSVSPEDFFAYTYAVLSAPRYVEAFSEELTIPGPRLPVSRVADLFRRAVEIGNRLLFLHTYGERFVPAGVKLGQIPAGIAQCTKGIPTKRADYPEEFSWTEGETPVEGVLRVGTGEFKPVSRPVWEFSVSGYEVVKSWLGFRMKKRSGRKSSPLDDIRPGAWTAALTAELLELLWVIEATVAAQPEMNALLFEILASPLFTAAELPHPTDAERRPPAVIDDDQHEMELE